MYVYVFSFLTLTDTEGALHPVQPCIFGCGRHQLVCPRPSDSFDPCQGGACIRRGLRGAAPIARRNMALESSLICFVNFWGAGVTCHSDQVFFSSSGGMDCSRSYKGICAPVGGFLWARYKSENVIWRAGQDLLFGVSLTSASGRFNELDKVVKEHRKHKTLSQC